MKFAFPSFVILCLCILVGPSAAAQERKSHVTADLVADTTAVAPGKPFTVALRLKIDPAWHIYWRYAGDAGAPPKITWKLPPGFQAGEIQWPLPEAHWEDPFLTYIYSGEVMLLVEITPPADLPAGQAVLQADVDWFVCSTICIRGKGAVDLPLPTGGTASPANAEAFSAARAALPKIAGAPAVKWDLANPKEITLTVTGLKASHALEFFPLPPEGAKPGHPVVSPSGGIIALPLEEPASGNDPWRALLVTHEGSSREGWYISSQDAATSPVGASSPPGPAAGGSSTSLPSFTLAPPKGGLLGILGLAFLGGLLMNIMPCVLPVITLKIFGFVKQAGEEPRRVFHLGLAFVAGVFAFFLALGTIAVILHSAGRGLAWGTQFQNPALLAGMIALIFVVGLNLLGVFEVTLGSGTTSTLSELSAREGFGGAFAHGLFTTLLGTSCTAPVMAASLGYTLGQPWPVIYLIFISLAAGMSLPYFLLTARPGWLRYLPKPGMWMERFKQLMGFGMLALMVWLFSLLAHRRPEAAAALSWFLFVLGLACWCFGAFRHSWVKRALVPLLILGSYFGFLHEPLRAANQPRLPGAPKIEEKDGIAWQPFNEGKLTNAVQRGEPVFIDFTADWCINCKFYEKTVLANDSVKNALRDKKVIAMRADWSEPDPEIERWLKRFGRVGVPLYVLYRPGEPQPVVMDLLTTNLLLHHLSLIRGGG